MFGNTYVLKPNVEKVQFWKNQVCLVSLFENASKFSHFCLGSFSLVSTNFSILSSLSGRIRPHLALETQNFRNIDKKNMKNLHSKCEKCNFYHLKTTTTRATTTTTTTTIKSVQWLSNRRPFMLGILIIDDFRSPKQHRKLKFQPDFWHCRRPAVNGETIGYVMIIFTMGKWPQTTLK